MLIRNKKIEIKKSILDERSFLHEINLKIVSMGVTGMMMKKNKIEKKFLYEICSNKKILKIVSIVVHRNDNKKTWKINEKHVFYGILFT